MAIYGETRHLDLKLDIDTSSDRAVVGLIRDLIAMANAGGGRIEIGRSETLESGVDQNTQRDLDSSRVIAKAKRFTSPYTLDIAHFVTPLASGLVTFTLEVSAAEYPIAMAEIGNWKGKQDKESALFRKGDVFTRHGTITEQANSEDYRAWIQDAKARERELLFEQFKMVVSAPDGAVVRVDYPTAYGPIDNAQKTLDAAASRRQSNPNHLLNADDLLHLFHNRASLRIDERSWRILFASALRKTSTLYWWLAQPIEGKTEIVCAEIEQFLNVKDRDKSDAARHMIALVCLYGDESRIAGVIEGLSSSRYKHFSVAAKKWTNAAATRRELCERVTKEGFGKEDRRLLGELTDDELESIATKICAEMEVQSSTALSKRLAAVTRQIWSRSDPHYLALSTSTAS